MDQIRKFLDFNGKTIYFLAVDGTYYVALKPICEALGLDWISQFKALKRSKILSSVLSNQTMQLDEKQGREYTCLPEKYVYGWLFKLQSSVPGFEEFQLKCYELLYDYFHGILARRLSTLSTRHSDARELARLELQLTDTPEWKRMDELRRSLKSHNRTLRELDQHLSPNQITLFS